MANDKFADRISHCGVERCEFFTSLDIFCDGLVQCDLGVPVAEAFVGHHENISVSAVELNGLSFAIDEHYENSISFGLGGFELGEFQDPSAISQIVTHGELGDERFNELPRSVFAARDVPSAVNFNTDGSFLKNERLTPNGML